jgi:hypothetical protein
MGQRANKQRDPDAGYKLAIKDRLMLIACVIAIIVAIFFGRKEPPRAEPAPSTPPATEVKELNSKR